MFPPLKKLNLLHRCAAFLLLATMVYQLGACPCGCLEHNAWIEFLHLDHDEHSHSTPVLSLDAQIAAEPHSHGHHDCTGERAAGFVDNARVLNFDSPHEHSLNLIGCGLPVNCGRHTAQINVRVDRAASPAAPLRPALQNFRL